MARLTSRLFNTVAIITGGARGMGASHARAFVREGARVVIADVLDDEGRALAAELGDAVRYEHLDVTSESEWEAVVAATVAAFGTVDVLVNNAGIGNMAAIDKYTLEMWNAVLAVNLTGTFLGVKAVVPVMKAARHGSIINISSVEGLRGSAGLHGYVASKFAVRGLTKSVAVELGRHNVRVNSVHPGFIVTSMTEQLDFANQQVPLGRPAQPEEVSSLVVFLASEESAYSTGAEFVVDGGMTSAIPHS
ncbi:glucose 1-dehydrogenase [Frigoribacterium sp. CG_9.8]|uniref:glucose 1-dehydrogenase n=1 Tax=Frigoribacterium sp. CG_9.8 TaxID=2787733 RepID=UPI0018CA7576|nr:glucose 1-dehydrogenase [Frigoribacterium sp. CG_9.8]MBG6107288.1 3alpha(or 20beta)-hydroxysteroid dehydrogenase [Frigoribacterium sp. CG_9.8]